MRLTGRMSHRILRSLGRQTYFLKAILFSSAKIVQHIPGIIDENGLIQACFEDDVYMPTIIIKDSPIIQEWNASLFTP